jgi:hypothetical protein
MATLETACELHDVADYIITSQQQHPQIGILQSWSMSILNDYESPLQAAVVICDRIYNANKVNNMQFDMTVLDTYQCNLLYASLDKQAVGVVQHKAPLSILHDLQYIVKANGLNEATNVLKKCIAFRIASYPIVHSHCGLSIAVFPEHLLPYSTYITALSHPSHLYSYKDEADFYCRVTA